MNVEINQFNHRELLNKYKHSINDNTYWHKIVVENVGGLDRDCVLKTIIQSCKPDDFIPVQYVSSKNSASFLLKNCGPAIQRLCSQNLIVINPYNDDKPFKISMKLCYSKSNNLKINIHLNIKNVLKKRYSSETGTLNLENFAKDTDLEEYCTLSQPKLFFYVLHIAKNIPFRILKLANNDIYTLNSMEALDGSKNPITLDLKNNCIKEISELNYFKHLNVTELWLDGNPICNNYSEITYGKSIKDHVKQLEKLDGINIKSQEFPPFRRNFICDATGYDLVDQFLEHYFTLYDSNNRAALKEMYHRDALFSLTSMYIPLQSTSSTAQLITYKNVARNLKQMLDISKNTQNLFIGPYLIANALSSLPETEHDPYSFTADLMMHTEEMSVLVVSGVFRECSVLFLEPDRLLGFTRTFVLLPGENGEYLIINEMLNVTNATTTQALRAFKQTKLPKVECTDLPRPQNIKELQDTIEALKAITGLTTNWARRCLEESDYDLTEALQVCIELFKKDKVPKSAVHSEQKEKNQHKTTSTSVARKQLTNEPTSTASSIGNTKSISQPASVVFPRSNIETETRSQSMTPAVGIARPINRQTPPTSLQSKLLNPMQIETNTDEPIIDFIDLTELNKVPSLPPSSRNKKRPVPPSSRNKKPVPRSLGNKKPSIPSLLDINLSSMSQLPGDTKPSIPSLLDINLSSISQLPGDTSLHHPSPSKNNTVIPRLNTTSNDEAAKKYQKLEKESKLETKFQIKSFKGYFKGIQDMYKKKDHKEVLQMVEDLLLKNRLHYKAFEIVFSWYYKTNLEEAREMKQKLWHLSNTVKPFISVWQLDLLFAICECMHGDFEIGETEFRKMIKARQKWARPITEFCRILLKKNQVEKARVFLKPYVTGGDALQDKMLRIAAELNKEYKVKLL